MPNPIDLEINQRLSAQLSDYRTEMRAFWLREVPGIGLIGAIVVFPLVWAMATYGAEPLDMDWRIAALLLWAVLMVPPIKLMHPEKPDRERVAYDLELNALAQRVRNSAHANPNSGS